MIGSGWILESEPGDHRTDGKWGVRERGVKDGTQVSGQVTGRKELAKNRGGAGVGVNGNGEFSFGLGGLRHLFDTLSRQLIYKSGVGGRNLGVIGIEMIFKVRYTYYLPDIGAKAVDVNSNLLMQLLLLFSFYRCGT